MLFQITLGMLKLKEPYFQNLENSAQIFNSLSDIPGNIDDVDTLFEASMNVGGVSELIFPRGSAALDYLKAMEMA